MTQTLVKQKTVLVVDDDASTRELMREILEESRYHVLLANDGLEAFEWAQKGHIDLILMDVRMPMFSGYWFCDVFRKKKNTANIPIVLVSGALDEEGVRKAAKAGACATVKKPFKADELLETVEKNILH